MEGYSRKHEGCHQFLELIPKDQQERAAGLAAAKQSLETSHDGLSDEKKLELRLGPPGGDWTINNKNNSSYQRAHHQTPALKSPWLHLQASSSHHAGLAVMKEPSQTCGNSNSSSTEQMKTTYSANTAVPNNSSNSAQKRTAPAPVVGWPPIRSFRKNLASGTSSKSEDVPDKVSGPKPVENGPKGLFVKINMDGIAIGRKVDLKAYDSYEQLSCAVDELFRGLLAAQNDYSCANGTKDKEEGGKVSEGILDRNGEYTLVYEDNEGDRMLVGDVPWHMFVSTVKRLRVLKSSELPTLSRSLQVEASSGKLSVDA